MRQSSLAGSAPVWSGRDNPNEGRDEIRLIAADPAGNLPIILDDALWKKSSEILLPTLPVTTSDVTILSNIPLAETIRTDGKSGGKDERFIVDESEEVKIRTPVNDAFLRALGRAGMKESDRGLIIFERTIVTDKGSSTYRISIETPNASLRTGYIDAIPGNGWTETGKHPVLFGMGGESHVVYLWFGCTEVKVGFASAGRGDFNGTYGGRIIGVGDGSDGRFGVLVKEQDLKVLATAVKTAEKYFGTGSKEHLDAVGTLVAAAKKSD